MPFDLAACASDLAPPPGEARTLADAARERHGPPPLLAEIALVDPPHRARVAAAIAAALPASWRPTVELDASGMAETVALEVPGAPSIDELAPQVLAFVRGHACLFGITAPDRVRAAPYADHFVALAIDPVSIGGVDVSIERLAGATRVMLAHHFWPIAPVAPKHVQLGRYFGRPFHEDIEMFPRKGPPGHRRIDGTVGANDLHVEPGPLLACRGAMLIVRAAAWIDLNGHGDDDVVRALPQPVDAAGAPVGPGWVMPRVVDVGSPSALDDRVDARGSVCLGRSDTP
ncbi:MAG TPA: hypothetical protein VGG74_25240 [Kofleriaceae bacterium]|jgi:hypothetical protein